MVRKKSTETETNTQDPNQEPWTDEPPAEPSTAILVNPSSTPREPLAELAGEAAKRAELKRKPIGHWRDNEVGVRMEEDPVNKLTTIVSRDRLPPEAQKLLEDNGYRKDGPNAYTKPIDYIRRREHREAAETLILDVDNILRAGKGLEPKQSFYISRS